MLIKNMIVNQLSSYCSNKCQTACIILLQCLAWFLYVFGQGSGNFEIWIGPADDDDVINEPISKKKKYVYITCHEN